MYIIYLYIVYCILDIWMYVEIETNTYCVLPEIKVGKFERSKQKS